MVRSISLVSNLPQLQRLIKIDPNAYREEFLQQWNHYAAIRQIFFMDPGGQQSQRYRELVSFISQVGPIVYLNHIRYMLCSIHTVRCIGRKVFPEGDGRISRTTLIRPA